MTRTIVAITAFAAILAGCTGTARTPLNPSMFSAAPVQIPSKDSDLRKLLVIHQVKNPTLPPDVASDAAVHRLAQYDTMDAISVSAAALNRIVSHLIEAGSEVRELEDVIRTPGRTIATSRKQVSVFPYEHGLYLLQYSAPATAAWQTAVRQSGVRVIDYLPERAVVVAGTTQQVAALSANPWVQYAGPYLAEHKFIAVTPADHSEFLIRFADTPDSASSIRRARDIVGGFTWEDRNASSLIAHFRADATTALALLAEPFVMTVEPYFAMQLSDERQAIGIEGVTAPTIPPATRYLNWLATYGITPSNLTASGIIVDVADTGVDWGYSYRVSEWEQWHPDLKGHVVYHNGTQGSASFPTFRDREGHGTIIASIVGGAATYQDLDDTNSANARLYGMGIAPGVRLGNTRITTDSGSVPSTGYVPSSWAQLAVSQSCYPINQMYPQMPPSGGPCIATVQTYSSNIYAASTAGTYGIYSREFDLLVREADRIADGNTQLAITISGGNYGQEPTDTSKYLLPPATAKNVIAVGATESMRDPLTYTFANTCPSTDRFRADNSSGYSTVAWVTKRGTMDGRLKPDFLAPATVTFGAKTSSALGTQCARYPLTQPYRYHGTSGTSFAAPVAAGSIALLRYKHGVQSPAMYKAMLTASSRSITGGTDRLGATLGTSTTVTKWPNEQQGFGVINLTDLLGTSPVKSWRDQQTILLNGQSYTNSVTVADPTKAVKISLAWTDAAAAETATVTLVNDLDLRAFGSTFRVYGNLTSADGFSTINPGCGRPLCSAYFNDMRNNAEIINIPASTFTDSANRTFTVQINAFLNGVGVPGASGGVNNQDFALIVVNGTLSQ